MSNPYFRPDVPRIYQEVSAAEEPVQAAPVPLERPRPFRPAVNLVLFLLTTGTVFLSGAQQVMVPDEPMSLSLLLRGWVFAVPLLAILLAHEFGHYIAAKIHGVTASLPYFIPMPYSPFGTMGAVISMRGRIKSRKALLDIGAAGPLAGMVVAIPVLIWGLLHSPVQPISGHGIQEGQCLLYYALKAITVGHIPPGSDVFLTPTAFAGWAGLFVTMLNLLPVGQLDGGHIAYALFGPRQNRLARFFHLGLLGLFAINLTLNLRPLLGSGPLNESLLTAMSQSSFWLVWFVLLLILGRVGGRDHPPTEPGELGTGRTLIAVGSLLLFVLLFMPTPMATY